jgi:hypothetical protein
MKPLVLASWDEPNGVTCVDILDLRDGTFGFSPCRRDPEDSDGCAAMILAALPVALRPKLLR